ncbi:hypothetical protein ARMGADRAFT_589949 [Armillaria gallica]|uniref:F-box domain-containing protein n=1 Tax=Armillaria gallica TaxID=47427 RepID=A0A2H3E530_ARMGA|nr:hypothetical protein ARMGADRAFT_589949 [Armillaria gallica]
MSCLTCSNCGFVNVLPPGPHSQTLKMIQDSGGLVSQLLRGSQPLLDADHAVIDAELTKLNRLRSWYDAQLQEIELYREEVKNRESIYAPIRRLPRDILLEIFDFICGSWWHEPHHDKDDSDESDLEYDFEDDDLGRGSLDVTGPLWVLGRVCGLWRDTLHSSPASWARYVLVKSPFSKHAPEILETYLKRTGGEIMSLLVQSCYRWENVFIRTVTQHMHHLESISHLPVLQTINIDIIDVDDSDYSSDMCLGAPQLWQATFPSHGIHQTRLPPTITHYSGPITGSKDLQLLSQLHKLRTCHLSSEVSTASIKEPVVMAGLYQLFVQDLDILDFLTAPMLQSLTIARGSPKSLSSIPAFFRRSGCHLESFSICMAIVGLEPSASISDIFSSEACSTISYLKLQLVSVWHNFSKAIASSSILPNLRHLVLCFEYQYSRHTNYKTTERPALLDMIRSRCKAGILKTIEVQFVGDEGEIAGDIRSLIGDNLEMRVEKWSPVYLDHWLSFWDPRPPM